MIGPPGLPKPGRPVFAVAGAAVEPRPYRLFAVRWAAGLYVAGVLAHLGDNMAYHLMAGLPLAEVLIRAPVCLVWPADLIGALLGLA
ncbi:MAG: hypothetical protein ACM3JG_09145 [Thiohalocapsa sp.]